MSVRALLAVCGGVLLASCSSGEPSALPPYGEAVIVVDTDLPVPSLASRLRVDLYDDTGRWFESRDIGRSDPRDWPASFSVFSDDETRERRVLVRLRAYPEGATRDYLGERFSSAATWQPPHVASDLADLCANAIDLPFGARVTMREGAFPITQHVIKPECTRPASSGATAARVTITTAGTYRFAVAAEVPFTSFTTLSLRSRCEDSATQLACRSGVVDQTAVNTAGHFPRFDVKLEPGTYYLITAGMAPDWPADVTLEALPVDLPLPPPAVVEPAANDVAPRLRRRTPASSSDETPRSEPVPSAAVDRLLAVRLVPGRRDRVDVVLRGACSGAMAKLGDDPRVPSLASAKTCIDAQRRNVRVEDVIGERREPPVGSEQGTFATGEDCEPSATTTERVCVPGGAFLMGSDLQGPDVSTFRKTTPQHIVAISKFWMDRNEVTVARFRDAVAKGLVAKPPAIFENERPIRIGPFDGRHCTWSTSPLGREDFPVSCLTWRLARSFCQSVGGDLPSEAQWEYAAVRAGRAFQTVFAWGNDSPRCDRAVLERVNPPCELADGRPAPIGPAPVTAADGTHGTEGDVSPLGIVNLMGSLYEWTRDSGQPYDAGCWLSASVRDPRCEEPHAPWRIAKGGSWQSAATASFVRLHLPQGQGGIDTLGLSTPLSTIGMRCVYGAPR